MSNTLKFGNGQWATKKGSTLAYNDENGNFKPLPFNFERAGTATRVNKEGLIEVVSNNEPRIDFSNDSKGALLLEAQRTNLFPYSEDYSQSVFTRRNCTINQNYAISPSGLLDATLISANGSDAAIFDKIGVTSGNTYTLSVYLRVESGTLDTTISLGSAGFPNTSGDGGRVKDITITTEWKRFTLTSTADANASSDIGIIGGFGGFNSGDEVYVWGAQLEEGSYATSYIPTFGSAVTRVAESCNGAGDASTFNDSEGVLFAEISALANDGTERRLSLQDNGTYDAVRITFTPTANSLTAAVYNNGANQFNAVHILDDATTFNKIAIKYKQNDFALWVNGIEVATDTNGSVFSNGSLDKLSYELNGVAKVYAKTKDLRVYNKALTDAELQALTS
jgi:hypothetical protein